jgi:hypothetical protein
MMSNITLVHVPNDAIKIAAILRYYSILNPYKICIMPEFNGKQQFFRAYIKVNNWSDSISSENLQARIKDPCKEARMVYQDDDWWAIEETEKEDMKYTESDAFQKWTTRFELKPKVRFAAAQDQEPATATETATETETVQEQVQIQVEA